MRNWLANNIQTIIYLLAFLLPVVSKGIAVLLEKRREAEAERLRGGPPARAALEKPVVQRAEVTARNREPETIQQELAAQRRAQIEMWKAREAMLKGARAEAPASARPAVEDEMARRRRLAMEELRRRQSTQSGSPRPAPAAPPAPTAPRTSLQRPGSRRSTAAAEARRVAARKRAAAPDRAPMPSTSDLPTSAAPIAASLRPDALETGEPRVVPGARLSGVGSIVLSRESLRKAFVMKELLDPPLAMRDHPAGASAGYHLPF